MRLLVLALLAGPALAQDVRAPTVALTISGGASLGNYEAGYVWYLNELLSLNPQLGDARIFTGTSAGSANALVALMERCRPWTARPQDSLGYRLWVPVGIDTLFDSAATTPIAAFSRQPLVDAVERLRAAWKEGLADGCDAVLGVSVTRLEPAQEQVAAHKAIPRALEHFVVRIRGHGPGRPPSVHNYAFAGGRRHFALLPTQPDGEVSFEALMPAVLASMAFPVAFGPVAVPHCISDAIEGQCSGDAVTTALFQDGGFFDNQPVRLAASIALRSFEREGNAGFLDVPLPRQVLPEGFGFVVVDHSSREYPSTVSDIPVPGAGQRPAMNATVPYAVYVTQQAVLAAHHRELLSLVEQHPEVALDSVATPVADPPLSELMGTFFGFFDRGLRDFDFQLGMRDARRFAERWVLPRQRARGVTTDMAWPEHAPERANDSALAGWRGYRCLRAIFDGVGDPKDCTAPELADFRAAAQVTLERLNHHCAALARRDKSERHPLPETSHERCKAAFSGALPPVVPGLTLGDDWRPRPDEDELNWTLRRLGEHGYSFADLHVPRGDYQAARRAVSRTLGDIVKTLGDRQDGGLFFALAGSAVHDLVADVPADHEVHAVLGNGLELGYSGTRGTSSLGWLRGHFGVRLDGVASLFGPQEYRHLTLSAMVGAEFQVKALSASVLKSRIGVRVGFSFSTADRLGTGSCPSESELLKPCSNPVVEVYYAASLIGRIRGQFGVAVLPGVLPGTTTSVLLTPGIGGEYEWP
ncbi:MAG: patatin-like phospholipase family protein [Myxococcota bacterium]